MYYSIIIDLTAGRNPKNAVATIGDTVQQELNNHHVKYMTVETELKRVAYQARRLADHFAGDSERALIVVGDDRTLHEVINGVLQSAAGNSSPLPIGYLPCGTKNEFASKLKITTDPHQALNRILNVSRAVKFNIGHYYDATKNSQGYFLNDFGIGLDAAVKSQINTHKRLKSGHQASIRPHSYLLRAINILYNQVPFPLAVQDGRVHHFFPNTFIAITSNYPRAQIDKNEYPLKLVLVEHHNWLVNLWVVQLFLQGKLDRSRWARSFIGTNLHYSTPSLEFNQVDGKTLGNRFVDLTITSVLYPFLWLPLGEESLSNF